MSTFFHHWLVPIHSDFVIFVRLCEIIPDIRSVNSAAIDSFLLDLDFDIFLIKYFKSGDIHGGSRVERVTVFFGKH